MSPPELVAARTATADGEGTLDVWEDITLPGVAVACFGSDPVAPGDALYLGTRASMAGYAVRLDLAAQAEALDRAARGLGKVLWTRGFEPKLYGAAMLSRAPR